MLDIDSLRLTDEDLSEYDGIGGISFDEPWVQERLRELANAQLAKALRGVQEWLTKTSADPKGYTMRSALTELNTLLVAGMARPEGD